IALIMNYRTADEQSNSIKDNAASALTMGTIILAAGSFLGILSGTGMLDSIAMDTVKIIPDFISPYIHLVIGFFGLPFDFVLSTDSYFLVLLLVVDQLCVLF